jgi:hypothetical protein
MAALAAISSATPSLQATLINSRLEQARRDADQAEAYAERLRVQADDQERIVSQARQRVDTLQDGLAVAANAKPQGPQQAPSADSVKTPVEESPTYSNTLAGVFQFAKPMLAMDMSTTQKNIVTSSLFEATSQATSVRPANSQAIQRYDSQVVDTASKTMGRVLNATA